MQAMKTILFQTGGPFHPVEAQANLIQSWLPSAWKIKPAFGTEAFEQLADADLYVAGGLHWTVLSDLSALIGSDPEAPIWESAQIEKHPYIPPTEAQKSEFKKYVQSGRPILAFHSGILSYDDWPEYGQLLGFRWEMGITDHTLYAGWKVKTKSSHAIVRGVPDYDVEAVDLGVLTGGAFTGQLVTAVFNLKTGTAVLESAASAPTDGTTVLLPLVAADVGVTSANPRFSYTAQTFDQLTGNVDTITTAARFNAFNNSISTGAFVTLTPGANARVPISINRTEFARTPALGAMVVSLENMTEEGGQALLLPVGN